MTRWPVALALALATARADESPAACTAVSSVAGLTTFAAGGAGCAALAGGVYALTAELRLARSVRLVAQPGESPVLSGARNGRARRGGATMSFSWGQHPVVDKRPAWHCAVGEHCYSCDGAPPI